MKQTFGILLILVSIFLIVAGASALTEANTQSESIEGRVGSTFSANYRSSLEEQQKAGTLSIGAGVILLIIGISLASSSSRPKNAYSHQTNIKHRSSKNILYDNSAEIGKLTNDAIKYYDNKEFSAGLALLLRALKLDPENNLTHLNLSFIYSKLENKEAYAHLAKAVEHGYSNFQKIQSAEGLEWLRNQAGYSQFVKSGYRLSIGVADTHTNSLEQLERLAHLRSQHILTEEEFQSQKNKILNN